MPVAPLSVAVVGCGTGGPAAALLLAEAGHSVELLERFPTPAPVGAGLLLQPTGMAVLERVGVAGEVLARGAVVEHVHGVTSAGRVVIDLRYSDLGPGVFGLGLHRGVLFAALWDALERRGLITRLGEEAAALRRGPDGTRIALRDGGECGPYDLVVVADGASCPLRAATGLVRRARRYPWGALWAILDDPEEEFAGTLGQIYRGTAEMIGFLASGRPAGVPQVSVFWSIHEDAVASWRAAGLDAWKRRVLALTPRAAPLLDQLAEPEQLFYASYHDVVMRRLHAPGLAFVGDAGHAMSPQLGQGVNLALLDALVLARCLAEQPELDAALAAYSAARRAHLRYYAWASRLMTPVFQSHLRPLGPVRDRLAHPVARIPWVRRQFLASLAGAKTGLFTSLDYRQASPAQLRS